MDPITAKQAHEIADENNKVDPDSKTLDYFFKCVRDAINDNPPKTEMNFSLKRTDYEDLTENELKYLKNELGYKISWNGACLWYVVEW